MIGEARETQLSSAPPPPEHAEEPEDSALDDLGVDQLAPEPLERSARAGRAWEPYQFKGGRSHDAVVPSPINPLQIADGYFHLQPAVLLGAAGGVDRGTRVDVARLGDEGAFRDDARARG
jgi:hypothetical protein